MANTRRLSVGGVVVAEVATTIPYRPMQPRQNHSLLCDVALHAVWVVPRQPVSSVLQVRPYADRPVKRVRNVELLPVLVPCSGTMIDLKRRPTLLPTVFAVALRTADLDVAVTRPQMPTSMVVPIQQAGRGFSVADSVVSNTLPRNPSVAVRPSLRHSKTEAPVVVPVPTATKPVNGVA